MTWIVGRPFLFGYSCAISDIRVTLADRSEKDCLQKIYPVGNFMALGFAGSVFIGFKMVARLTELLRNDDPESAWEPEAVAEWWPADAAQVFSNAPSEEQAGGCELMLLSVHPTENAGAAPWARSYVHRFYAPDFTAEQNQNDEVISIGSGSGVKRYVEAMRATNSNFSHLQMEVGSPGGAAYGLMTAVRFAVENNPEPGISRHFQVCIVRRGEVNIHHYNRKSLDGSGRDLVMPTLAQNPSDLEVLLGDTAEGARC